MFELLPSLTIPLEIFDIAQFCNWFFDHASYWFVFVFMVIESSFIPFPSEVVVPPAVFVACHDDRLEVLPIVLFATLGALVGATINYWLSVWLGRPIIYRFANSRIGHLCMIDEAKVQKSEKYFDKNGALSTLVGRLIPVVRQLISIPAGLAKMNFAKFALFTGIGALIWNTILATIGYVLAQAFSSREEFMSEVETYNSYLTWGGLALLVIAVAYLIYKKSKKKKTDSIQ